jgi:hypothetical protein
MADVCGKYVVPILLGAALSLVIDVAAAEVASDNELYAAYCIGVLQHRAEYEQGLADDKQSQDAAMRRLLQEDTKNLNQKLSRFRTYLAVRGFRPRGGRDPQAFTGIQVALQRGQADVQQCDQFSEKTCTPRCPFGLDGDVDAIMKCVVQCLAENAACRSSERCLQADNLPF